MRPPAAAPLVAVSGRPTRPGTPWRAPGFGTPAAYVESLERAGGLGAVIGPVATSAEDAARRLAPFAGLLLTGGPDVAPDRYGQARHPTTYGASRVVDDAEEALLGAALALGRPVLAICRGLQLVNVAHGGSLHQHLGDLGVDGHGQPGRRAGSVEVGVAPGSRLAQALGAEVVRTSCHHHQGVDRVGEGLVVSGRAADGVVEGLELAGEGRWLVAVQWHPEDLAHEGGAHHRLFEAFVAACASCAAEGR